MAYFDNCLLFYRIDIKKSFYHGKKLQRVNRAGKDVVYGEMFCQLFWFTVHFAIS